MILCCKLILKSITNPILSMKSSLIPATIVLFLFFIIPIVILNYLYSSNGIWDGLTLGVAGTFEEFCERNRMDAFLRERMNSWSNLAFVWFGLIVLFTGLRSTSAEKSKNVIDKYPILSVFTGISFLYLGIGSFLYHAALTRFTQLLDVAGTYAAVASVICLGFVTLIYPKVQASAEKTKNLVAFMLILTFIADVLLFRFKWQISSSIVLPMMIVILIGIVTSITLFSKMQGNLAFAMSGIISVATAFLVWYLDVKKIFCNPDSLLQGHALWHVLTGLSLFLMYNYFRSVKTNAK
jgi:hypothetical protein